MATANSLTASKTADTVPPKFYIAIPPADLAQDAALVAYLVEQINEVYTIAEAGIFDEKYLRTNPTEIVKYITNGLLALASDCPSSPWDSPNSIQGCIRITRRSDVEGELGMMITTPAARGTGLGKLLMEFAEEHCRGWGAQKMRLDLLVPVTFKHDLKVWVQAWYERLGYRLMGVSDFRDTYPRIADSVITETEYRWFEKAL